MKAQIPPSTATLTDNASNSVMAFPINLTLRDRAFTKSVAVFLGSAPLLNLT